MRNAAYIPCGEMNYFDHVSKGRRQPTKGNLASIRPRVADAYLRYASATEVVALRQGSFRNNDDANALRSNYDALTRSNNRHIRDEALSRSKVCCYCGLRDSSELDHYLPRSRYPEFSMLTENLVPICHDCNHRKGERFRHAKGGASFLHAYRDRLPSTTTILTAKILVADGSVAVDVNLDESAFTDPRVAAIARRHFDNLALRSLLSEHGQRELQRQAHYLDGKPDAKAVGDYLAAIAVSFALSPDVGESHVSVVTLRAASLSEEFCGGGFRALLA